MIKYTFYSIDTNLMLNSTIPNPLGPITLMSPGMLELMSKNIIGTTLKPNWPILPEFSMDYVMPLMVKSYYYTLVLKTLLV